MAKSPVGVAFSIQLLLSGTNLARRVSSRSFPKLFDLLGGDSWTVYPFLTQHNPELEGDTALSGLQRGHVNQELTAAENTADSLS
jgi:hypothetical protein